MVINCHCATRGVSNNSSHASLLTVSGGEVLAESASDDEPLLSDADCVGLFNKISGGNRGGRIRQRSLVWKAGYCADLGMLRLHHEGFSVRHCGSRMLQSHICSRRENRDSLSLANRSGEKSWPHAGLFIHRLYLTGKMQWTHPFDTPQRSITIFTSFTGPYWENTCRSSLSFTCTYARTDTHIWLCNRLRGSWIICLFGVLLF